MKCVFNCIYVIVDGVKSQIWGLKRKGDEALSELCGEFLEKLLTFLKKYIKSILNIFLKFSKVLNLIPSIFLTQTIWKSATLAIYCYGKQAI